MGRREQRRELESTWNVYVPRKPGTPFTRKDVEDADERSSQGEPMSPGKLPPRSEQTRASVNGALTLDGSQYRRATR